MPDGVNASARTNAYDIHNNRHHPIPADASTAPAAVFIGGFSAD